MYNELIPIIGIVFGTLLVAFVFGRITGLIKQAMKNRSERKHSTQDKEEILREFERFRQKTERRLQNLEAIVTDEEDEESELEGAASQKGYSKSTARHSSSVSNKSQKTIQMDDEQQSGPNEGQRDSEQESKGRSASSSKLNNMLKS